MKRRFDLIPNLVTCVKGYRDHEAQLQEELAALLRLNPNVPVLADVPYENQDQEYLDAVALDRILKKAAAR